MKGMIVIICLGGLWCQLICGMEWRQEGAQINFKTADGNVFVFRPSPYSGIQVGKENFFLHVAAKNNTGKRESDLRMEAKIVSVRRVAANNHSEQVEVVVPMVRLNERVGKVSPSPNLSVLTFRLWKDLPVLDVSVKILYRERTSAQLCLFWLCKLTHERDCFGGTRESPPPERLVLEPRVKKGSSAPGGDVLLVYGSQEASASLGIIGQSARYYTESMLQLFPSWNYSEIRPGESLTFDLVFAQPRLSGKKGVEELRELSRVLKILGSVDYLKSSAGSMPSQGVFHKFSEVKGKRVPGGYATLGTRVGFWRSGADICIGFHCEEQDTSKMVLRYSAANDPVWGDDCVEICVGNDWKKRGFIQFIGNVKGARNQLSHGASVDLGTLDWRLNTALQKKYWNLCFTLTPKCFDEEFMQLEGYLPIHVNRESHSSREYSGWPTERFNEAGSFGRLLTGTYGEYLEKQVAVIKMLLQQGGGMLLHTFGKLKQQLPDFEDENYYRLALADEALRTFRHRVEFQLTLETCYGMLKRLNEKPENGHRLETLMEQLEKSIVSEEMRMDFNRLRGDVLKLVSHGMDYLVWSKSPWTYLKGSDYPVAGIDYNVPTVLHAGQNEYESASFAVTNFSDRDQNISVSVVNNPSEVPVVIRYCFVAKSSIGEVNDALPLLNGPLHVPARQSRELHLTMHTGTMPPGRHRLSLRFTRENKSVTRQIELVIHPVRLEVPARTYNVFFSPLAMMRRVVEPQGMDVFFNDMDAHYCRVRQLTGGSIARPVFDEQGVNRTDYSGKIAALKGAGSCDYIQDYWGLYGGKDSRTSLEKLFGCTFMSDQFRYRFTQWLQDYYKAIRNAGIKTDNLQMYMFDETSRPEELELMRLAKQVVPEMNIYMTISTTTSMQTLKQVLPYLDGISPHFYTWRNKQEAWTLIRQHGVKLCPYFNVAPASSKDEPYSVYRRMGWLSKSVGGDGAGTWVYFYYYASWSPVSMNMVQVKHKVIPSSLRGAPERLAPGEVIVPTKRWEGYREGMEEFYYLGMLERCIVKHGGTALAEEAKALVKNAVKNVCETDRGWERDLTTQEKVKILHLLRQFQNLAN